MAQIENLGKYFLETHNGSFILSYSPSDPGYNHSRLRTERTHQGTYVGSSPSDLVTLVTQPSPDKYIIYTAGLKQYSKPGSAIAFGYNLLINHPDTETDSYTNLLVGLLMEDHYNPNLVYAAAEVKVEQNDGIILYLPTIAFDPYFGQLDWLLKQGLINREQLVSIFQESITNLELADRGSARWVELEFYKSKNILITKTKELSQATRRNLWIEFLNQHADLGDLPNVIPSILLRILYLQDN